MSTRQRFFRYILPLFGWMGFIFSMSTDAGSSTHSKTMVRSILRSIAPRIAESLSPELVNRIDFDLRKSAHILEYTVLGILAYRAFAQNKTRFQSSFVIGALMLGIGNAASDEWHQSFIPSRWGIAGDVLYDSFGVVIGVSLCLWRQLLRTNQTIKS